jgi:surface protein
MFALATAFNGNISWDNNVSSVTNMSGMFYLATAFNQNIGNWDVIGVDTMRAMFLQATTFNQDIGSWNVSNVKDMTGMFTQATTFNQNIGNWNVSNVVNMSSMFAQATAFNQNIGSWIVSSVDTMHAMFAQATAFNQDISSWTVSNVEDLSLMFFECSAFNQNIGSWDVSKVMDMDSVFHKATAFNQDIGSWNVSSATEMTDMLSSCGINVTNYDNTLIGWAAQTVQSGVTLGATGLYYCSSPAQTARNTLLGAPNNWTIVGDIMDCSPPPLPVELIRFKGTQHGNQVKLNWTTSNEAHNYGFEIEWSKDNQTWKNIGFVKGKDESSELKTYQFTHTYPMSGINYYRLQQIDFDGEFEYSKTVSVEVEGIGGSMFFFPNPSQAGVSVNLRINSENFESGELSLFDINGKKIYQQTITSSTPIIDVSGLASGIYSARLTSGRKLWTVRLLIE